MVARSLFIYHAKVPWWTYHGDTRDFSLRWWPGLGLRPGLRFRRRPSWKAEGILISDSAKSARFGSGSKTIPCEIG